MTGVTEMTGSTATDGPVLEVESLAHGGDGVAREPGGRVVFVPRTAPGDRVRVELVEEHDRWARGRMSELVSPGPSRREAPCPYYDECGGCQLQHVDPVAELEAKREAVLDTLERIGGREIEVPPPVSAGPRLGYRNRVTLTLRRGQEGRVRAGYHHHEDPSRLVDVSRCPLAEPAVNGAWADLRESWGEGAERLPDGSELRITVRATEDGDAGILIEGGDPEAPGDPGALDPARGSVTSAHWAPTGEAVRPLWGPDRLPERWRGRRITMRPRSFLQVNRLVADRMEAYLDSLLEADLASGGAEGRRILDLYAGLGLRAIRWAEAGADAVACEREPHAVADGRDAARAADAEVEFREGPVEEHLAGLLPADVAVVNPPRSGLSRRVCRILAGGGAARLAYVSCEPSTLARDLDRLGDAWGVASVQPFDAFPQTGHVETVAWLESAA